MGAHIASDPASWVAAQDWRQTSLFGDVAAAVPGDDAFRAAREALAAADDAAHPRRQRAALDQLAQSLAQQAQRRGRAPIPKRAAGRDVT